MKSLLTVALLTFGVAATDSVDKSAKSEKSCRALALSGGGAKGSFEAGALYGLVMNDVDKSKYRYDVVTGVSAGAINTGAISVFDIGDEENLVQFLSETWSSIVGSDVYKQWSPLGIVTGILFESGVFDDTPLSNFLASVFEQFSYEIKRRIVVSCADVVSGNYITFNETTNDPVKAIVSSASIPFVFPHQVWSEEVVCMDGGTVWNTNLASAIHRCEEIVDDHSQITMDVIICDDYQFAPYSSKTDTLGMFNRYKDIKDSYSNIGDVYDLMKAFPKVNYRYYIQPSQPLPGGLNLLNFDNTTNTWPMQMTGRLDAENALKDGEGFMFNKMLEWDQSPDLKIQYPRVNDYVTKTVIERAAMHKKERKR